MTSPSIATNTVPSSSTLWATASKEWVITPKPKPGRKPKKDISNATKAAQRAFRERKQSQLAELQARVQSYEQGEIERNVALQNIAKRLKEENEILRAENAMLKEKLLKSELAPAIRSESDKKRLREDSSIANPAIKRIKASEDSPSQLPTLSFTPSSPSTASSTDSPDSSDNPLPNYEMQPDSIQAPQLLEFSSLKPTEIDGNTFPSFDCGFCTEDTPCMCRELVQQVHAQSSYDQSNLASNIHTTNPIQFITGPPSHPECILENLPPYQPAVPLRRRPGTSNVNSVFAVTVPTSQAPTVTCSGDPSNCMACADDAFGKAFCFAIEKSVASRAFCTDCPCNRTASLSSPHHDGCENPSSCSCRPARSDHTRSTLISSIEEQGPETMPTNDAWQQIKAHPNVSFADLSLLAEVVVRRSKCTGPKVVISPVLESVTPEHTASPASSATNLPVDHESVLLTDPHAHFRAKERVRSSGPSPSPRLVPQDVLIRCGRQRVRAVQTDAVHAALRLLDAKFT
ncbi:hypothetical protein C0992_012960 [Termitomyces sp. T32_za158]|nr:hypothetical protein C0992_012960 [Termitomyces sp. T32_za158]